MNENNTLLLAPNYVKDVHVEFGDLYHGEFGVCRKLKIELEINDDEANKLRGLPGMDDYQFVCFLTPCIQTAIIKTIQGLGKNNVKIEEMKDSLPEYNPYQGDEPYCY